MTTNQPDEQHTSPMAPDSAVSGWLASAHPSPGQAQREWSSVAKLALLPLGERFDAVRIPEAVVHAVTGSAEAATVDSRLAAYLNGGPVVRDPHSCRYYALVPPGTAERWKSPIAECLGHGTYLGVPRTDRTELGLTWNLYWSVPMSHAGALCREADVLRLVTTGRRLTGEESS